MKTPAIVAQPGRRFGDGEHRCFSILLAGSDTHPSGRRRGRFFGIFGEQEGDGHDRHHHEGEQRQKAAITQIEEGISDHGRHLRLGHFQLWPYPLHGVPSIVAAAGVASAVSDSAGLAPAGAPCPGGDRWGGMEKWPGSAGNPFSSSASRAKPSRVIRRPSTNTSSFSVFTRASISSMKSARVKKLP